jgi:hypothetical protein
VVIPETWVYGVDPLPSSGSAFGGEENRCWMCFGAGWSATAAAAAATADEPDAVDGSGRIESYDGGLSGARDDMDLVSDVTMAAVG